MISGQDCAFLLEAERDGRILSPFEIYLSAFGLLHQVFSYLNVWAVARHFIYDHLN
ncbi:hypothetical protein JOD21_002967 [Jeotgalibacillus terrae]|uniref:Uncharacterized protein n=1 Tax=Jeotgalibacillus terrae TaxID=587735 RepID=A0ABW5ZK47_9BACL|nr:hypothetical protein [Jeotgalibacillus terrae]MBM7580283.1 hypothetical protein [Jeotgalibacillus terrae]